MTSEVNTLLDCPSLSYLPLTQVLSDIISGTSPDETFDVIAVIGPHGTGKSEWPEYLATAMGIPAVVETMSGKEPTDIIGNPYNKIVSGVQETALAPPSWFNSMKSSVRPISSLSDTWLEQIKKITDEIPDECRPERILFMDEYDRVHPDTFGPMMNIVLTNEHHGTRMTNRTLILLAGNGNSVDTMSYNVNELDPAQQSRVRPVRISPSIHEWEQVVTGSIHDGIISYVKENVALFNAFSQTGTFDLRTFTRLGKRLKNLSPSIVEERGAMVANMFVPTKVVASVMKHIKDAANGISVEDLLDDYQIIAPTIKELTKKNDSSTILHLAKRIVPTIKDRVKRHIHSPNAPANVTAFLKDSPRPVAFNIFKILSKEYGTCGDLKDIMMLAAKDTYLRSIITLAKKEKAGT